MTTTPTTRAAAIEAALARHQAHAEATNHSRCGCEFCEALRLPPDAPASGDFAGRTEGPWSWGKARTYLHIGGPAEGVYGGYVCRLIDSEHGRANARLICAAVNERPALLAERDALQAEMDEIREWCSAYANTGRALERERDALRQQVAELREALREATIGLDGAWQMLSAICETDSSADRTKARDRAAKACAKARAALAKVQP